LPYITPDKNEIYDISLHDKLKLYSPLEYSSCTL